MKRRVARKAGVTMVEVIVSFAVLLFCLLMVETCIRFSGQIQISAMEKRSEIAQLEESLYSGDIAESRSDTVSARFSGTGASSRLGFTIALEQKTLTDENGTVVIGYESIP